MRSPVHTAECPRYAAGAPDVFVVVHVSAAGSYVPPVFDTPPHTTIRLPVHTAVCVERCDGAPDKLVGVHASATGS